MEMVKTNGFTIRIMNFYVELVDSHFQAFVLQRGFLIIKVEAACHTPSDLIKISEISCH